MALKWRLTTYVVYGSDFPVPEDEIVSSDQITGMHVEAGGLAVAVDAHLRLGLGVRTVRYSAVGLGVNSALQCTTVRYSAMGLGLTVRYSAMGLGLTVPVLLLRGGL
jgi:hypothetical protein